MIFSDSTSLYFYSALLQGNAALISITAMLIIYKKQSLDISFDRLERSCLEYLQKTFSFNLLLANIFDIKEYREDFFDHLLKKEEIKIFLNSEAWKEQMLELEVIDKFRNSLWSEGSKAFLLLFLVLATSVVVLPLSIALHQSFLIELAFIVVFTIAELVGLLLLFRFINMHLR